jgi:hypothetical protein
MLLKHAVGVINDGIARCGLLLRFSGVIDGVCRLYLDRLHQGTGKPFSPFHILITSLFVELGLMATAFAMLAPTLAICGIRLDLV